MPKETPAISLRKGNLKPLNESIVKTVSPFRQVTWNTNFGHTLIMRCHNLLLEIPAENIYEAATPSNPCTSIFELMNCN